MKQLYLKCQQEALKLENVINFKRVERNTLIDEQKKAKKEKDTDTVADCKRRIQMAEDDILNLEVKYKETEREFEKLRHKCGKLRLDLYVFADILYNSLIEYEEFINKYVVNKDGDKDVMNAVSTAINAIKKLPFEMAEGGYTNDLYCAVAEKFMDRWQHIRDGVIMEVLREVDNEFTN